MMVRFNGRAACPTPDRWSRVVGERDRDISGKTVRLFSVSIPLMAARAQALADPPIVRFAPKGDITCQLLFNQDVAQHFLEDVQVSNAKQASYHMPGMRRLVFAR